MSCDNCSFPYSLCQCATQEAERERLYQELLARKLDSVATVRAWERTATREQVAQAFGCDVSKVCRTRDGAWTMR